MSGVVVAIEDLHVTFSTPRGEVRALRGVSLEVRAGRMVCLIGESGSGKSVTGRALMGLLPAHSARIGPGSMRLHQEELLGKSESAMRSIRGRRIAMIFQDPSRALNPTRRIGDQVGEAIKIHFPERRPSAVRSKVLEHLDSVKLPDAARVAKKYPHELSGGMRQRVAIAMALSAEPEVLVADEPTTALDVTTQVQILDLLRSLQRSRGMSVLLITHDMGVAAHYADDVAVMYAGRVVERAPAAELFADVEMPYTQALLESLPSARAGRGALQTIPGGPPDLALGISGCAFAPRCRFVTSQCKQQPATREVAGDHVFECWHPVGKESR
jgi:oligopeptide/dipeptide ABC transporter ATP-binding protein